MRTRLAGCLVGAALSLAIFCSPAWSQTAATNEDEIVKRVTESVLRSLEEDGRLERAVERGIERFVREQRERQAQARSKTAEQRAKGVRRVAERDHVVGNLEAEISLIEYSDFECPFCKRFHPTARQTIEHYAGKVNWVYRHFPLEFHNPNAQKQAEASECAAELAGNDGFWRFADTLYERTRSNKGFAIASLVPLAVELGMDETKFRECLDSGRTAGRVKEDYEEGQKSGITGTPGNILLNNRTGQVRVVSGAASSARLRAAIDSLMSTK